MLVNYHQSPVGPYEELLLIPGKISNGQKSGYSISHIHVSTDISTVNGRKHWGIPKETSSFNVHASAGKLETVIKQEEEYQTEILASSYGFDIPIFTHALPYRLIQSFEEKWCSLRPTAFGKTKLARLDDYYSNMSGFNLLNDKKPLIGFHATSFKMKFPDGKWS